MDRRSGRRGSRASGHFAGLGLLAGLLSLVALAPALVGAVPADSLTYPLNVLKDQGKFTFYLNEEVLVRTDFKWRSDGSYSGSYAISTAGQTVVSSLEIKVDSLGHWTGMMMDTPRGPIEVAREEDKAKITWNGQTQTAILKPGTRIFENFSPALMSQVVIAYDQAAGGKQTFPLFIIPGVVIDASLERLDTMERSVGGRLQKFTLYRYGLPNVDITLWVDDANRICFGDVPAQHGAYVREGYEALMIHQTTDSTLSQPSFRVTVDQGTWIPMRDGVKLSADIYRPDAPGKFPVVLVRTPYKKEMSELQGRYFARRGYVYAAEDCRGRFASEGKWNPFFDEPADGYDSVEWLASQPWSTGKVGMIGASYVGWVQWWAAREVPPHLVTIIPNVSPPDPYFNMPYEYGAFFMWGAIWWADVLEENATGDLSGKAFSEIAEKKYAKLLRALPVIDLDKSVLGKPNAYWRDWIAHPDNDQYWDRASFLERLAKVDIPVYHQSGWYDGDGIGTKLNYLAMAKYGHKNQKLVIGPWPHTASATRMGPRNTDFGPNATIDLETSYLRWLDHWLKGVNNGIDREPMVALFVMGSDKWLTGDTYPLPETEFTNYYLTSQGKANTSWGDGRLMTSAPGSTAGAAADAYTYDPADPTPDPIFYINPRDTVEDDQTKGKESNKPEVSTEDQQSDLLAYYGKVDGERQDILVYDTPFMTEPLTIAGPVSAVIYASSSGKDTDWFVRLSEVEASGGVYPLVHGVIRARYRNSFAVPELLAPGQIYEYHVDMWQTGITIPVGARLRVEVASAAFPLFSRNLNTGGHNETETNFVSAAQNIYHDAAHPSHIVLPVIRQPALKDTVK
ncbi:MAG TPA: CocE/NonD family hydrolase [bacterium]|nr:CocE/NonD family hydrolase [bacterium]